MARATVLLALGAALAAAEFELAVTLRRTAREVFPTASLALGSPPQEVTVLPDTGSDPLWVASRVGRLGDNRSWFDANKSVSFRARGENAAIHYGAGNVSFERCEERLTLPTSSLRLDRAASADVQLGVADKVPRGVFAGLPFDGVMGLAPKEHAWWARALASLGAPRRMVWEFVPRACGLVRSSTEQRPPARRRREVLSGGRSRAVRRGAQNTSFLQLEMPAIMVNGRSHQVLRDFNRWASSKSTGPPNDGTANGKAVAIHTNFLEGGSVARDVDSRPAALVLGGPPCALATRYATAARNIRLSTWELEVIDVLDGRTGASLLRASLAAATATPRSRRSRAPDIVALVEEFIAPGSTDDARFAVDAHGEATPAARRTSSGAATGTDAEFAAMEPVARAALDTGTNTPLLVNAPTAVRRSLDALCSSGGEFVVRRAAGEGDPGAAGGVLRLRFPADVFREQWGSYESCGLSPGDPAAAENGGLSLLVVGLPLLQYFNSVEFDMEAMRVGFAGGEE